MSQNNKLHKEYNTKPYTVKDYLFHGLFFFIYGLVKYFPSPLGDYLRFVLLKLVCRHLGKVRIYEGVTFWYPYRISIGNNVTLNEWGYLSGYGEIEIEDDVRIGHRVSILTSDHRYTDLKTPIYRQGLVSSKVKILKGAWLGCNVTVLPGVTIGQGAVVGAGAVVTKNVKDFEIVAGVPARPIGSRKK
ncbi:MAG: acyltransferase [Patescibacteria group bacterium]|jgi:acetyltransferase-like isoleucine patch superfamily enzyme